MKKFSRALAWLLSIVMILGMLPATFAAEKAEPIEVLNADEAIDPTIPIFENPQYSFAERPCTAAAAASTTRRTLPLLPPGTPTCTIRRP